MCWSRCCCRVRRWRRTSLHAVSPAGVQLGGVISAPDDHFAAGPNCRVTNSARGRVGRGGRDPTVCVWIVSPACFGVLERLFDATPNYVFSPGPNRRVNLSRRRRVGDAGGCPTVAGRIESPSGIGGEPSHSQATPDDHLIASPYCRVTSPAKRRIDGAGRYPTISTWMIPAAGIE